MNALSKLFEVLHLSRGEMTLRRSHRRRRARRRESSLSCETLEPKQLLAADVAVQFTDQVFDTTDPLTIAIEGKFQDTAVSGTVVKFETNAPLADDDFYVELTDNTPLTNANFLSYVNSGAYDNSKFHRSVSDFVVQGGGFKAPTVAADQPGSDPVAISTTGTVQNEPGNLNTRGTIAMAKLGGQPDSATSQFFFNLSDNSFLDSDNGGYTQFGSVLGSGMTVVDTIGSALTYDATTYYSNTALSDLPLWNVNQDNIVRPQDFVQIENADVVTESALFTYQVSSSDSAKLTASFDGNGNLLLTPVGDALGSVNVTVTATSKLDNTTASDVFSVQLNGGGGGPVDPVNPDPIQIPLYRDLSGKIYAGGQQVSIVVGTPLRTNSLGAEYTVMASADFGFNGGKQVLFQKTNGDLVTWQCDDDWVRASNLPVITSADSAGQASKAADFSVNLGSFGGLQQLAEIDTTGTKLLYDATNTLYADGNQISIVEGTPLRANSLGSEYRVLGVEDFGEAAGGKQVLIKKSNGDLVTWQCDDNWVRTSNLPVITSADSAGQASKAADFDVSIEDPAPTITPLYRSSSLNVYASGVQVSIVVGTPLRTNSLGAEYTVMASADFGLNGGKQVLFQKTNGDLVTWQCDDDWVRASNLPVITSADSAGQASKAADFSVNLGSFGGLQQLAEIDTTGTKLLYDATNTLYADGNQISIVEGTPLRANSLGSEYRVLGVEDFGEAAGGKQVLIKKSNGDLVTWQCDDNWVRTSNLPVITSADSAGQASKAADFDVSIEDPAPTITPLYRSSSLNVYASGVQVSIVVGTPLRTNSLGAEYTVMASADFGLNGGKQVLFQKTNGDLVTWQCDDDWVRASNLPVITSADSAGQASKAADFSVNLGSFGGLQQLAEIDTTGTKLLYDATNTLYADGNQISIVEGTPLRANSLGSEYRVLGVEDFGEAAGGKQVLIKKSNGDLVTWQCDDNWVRTSNLPVITSADSAGQASKAADFDVSIEDPAPTITPLYRSSSLNVYASGVQVSIVVGTPLRTNSLGAEYTVMASADFGLNGGKQVLFQKTNGDLVTWQCDDDWVRASNLPVITSADSAGQASKAADFSVNLGSFGGLQQLAEIDTTGTKLLYDATNTLYADGNQISIVEGTPLRANSLGSDYQVIGAEDFGEAAGGKQVLFEKSNGDLVRWQCDDSWTRISNLPVILSSNVAEVEAAKTEFGVA